MSDSSKIVRPGSSAGRRARAARRVGVEAEDAAARFLLDLGFTIITRRFKSRSGEIDLVALDGEILVLVEVKQSLASGAEARIDEGKIERLRLAADEYMLQYPGPYAECRFDVVTVCAGEFHHYRDALPWA